MNDVSLYNLFSICENKKKFVYEVCDLFGDRLSIEEYEYWNAFSTFTSAQILGVDIKGLDYEDAMLKIETKIAEHKK